MGLLLKLATRTSTRLDFGACGLSSSWAEVRKVQIRADMHGGP